MPPLPSTACVYEGRRQFRIMLNAVHYTAGIESRWSVFNRLRPIDDQLWKNRVLQP